MMPYRTKTRLRRYKLLLKRAAVVGGILWISFNVLLGGLYPTPAQPNLLDNDPLISKLAEKFFAEPFESEDVE